MHCSPGSSMITTPLQIEMIWKSKKAWYTALTGHWAATKQNFPPCSPARTTCIGNQRQFLFRNKTKWLKWLWSKKSYYTLFPVGVLGIHPGRWVPILTVLYVWARKISLLRQWFRLDLVQHEYEVHKSLPGICFVLRFFGNIKNYFAFQDPGCMCWLNINFVYEIKCNIFIFYEWLPGFQPPEEAPKPSKEKNQGNFFNFFSLWPFLCILNRDSDPEPDFMDRDDSMYRSNPVLRHWLKPKICSQNVVHFFKQESGFRLGEEARILTSPPPPPPPSPHRV